MPTRLTLSQDKSACCHEIRVHHRSGTHAALWDVIRWIDRGTQGCRGLYTIRYCEVRDECCHYLLAFECEITAMLVKLNWG